jgi:hypothetical protein
MKEFICACVGKSNAFWLRAEGVKYIKGPFTSLSDQSDLTPLQYYACCSDCGTEFGPGESLEDLEQILKEEWVLI